MDKSWCDRFSDFEGSSQSSGRSAASGNSSKKLKTGHHLNNSSFSQQKNRSAYRPLRFDGLKQPAYVPQASIMGPPSATSVQKTKFNFKPKGSNNHESSTTQTMNTAAAIPAAAAEPKPPEAASADLEEIDWGDDDFDIDLNSVAENDSNTQEQDPKITDDELQEMTMALFNDDSIFEFDDDPPIPMDPSKARLNQTTAVFENMENFYKDEEVQPHLIIQSLREELNKLNADLKAERSEKTVSMMEKEKLEDKLESVNIQLEREKKLKKNLEIDQRREVEKFKKADKEKDKELSSIRGELEKIRLKAEARAAEQPLKKITLNQQEFAQEGNKRKRICLDPEPVKDEPLLPAKKEDAKPGVEARKQDLTVPVFSHLQDFFLEQFCQLSTTDLRAQTNLLIRSRRGPPSATSNGGDTWQRMLSVSADTIATVSSRTRSTLKNGSSSPSSSSDDEARKTSKTTKMTQQRQWRSQHEVSVVGGASCASAAAVARMPLDDLASVEAELANMVYVLQYAADDGDSLHSAELELVLDTASGLLGLMLETQDQRLIGAVTRLLCALWTYELPPPDEESDGASARLLAVCGLVAQNLAQVQNSGSYRQLDVRISSGRQFDSRTRQSLLELFSTITSEESLRTKVCSKSSSCFLQSILLEIESGCQKLKLVRDQVDLFYPGCEEDAPRLEDGDLTENYKAIVESADVIKRFIDETCSNHSGRSWINLDCVDCNSVMLRAVVALVFSTLNIYLDVFSDVGWMSRSAERNTSSADQSTPSADQTFPSADKTSLSHQDLVDSLEKLVSALYSMKMEMSGRHESGKPLWIGVVERMKIGDRKKYMWSLAALKHIIREPHLSTLQSLLMERSY